MDVVMSISSFDSSGSSGVQADLLTFKQFDIYGTSVVTTLRAQNTLGYEGSYPVTSEFVINQIETIMRDFDVKAIKVGLLDRKDIIEAIARTVKRYNIPIILDAIIRTEGSMTNLNNDEIEAYREHLINMADVMTVTVPALSTLSDVSIFRPEDIEMAVNRLFGLGAKAVIVKGSDLNREFSIDSIYMNQGLYKLSAARVNSLHAFGSSCVFSAALTAGIAKGLSLVEAAVSAKKYVTTAIINEMKMGKGMPLLSHFISQEKWEKLPVEIIQVSIE